MPDAARRPGAGARRLSTGACCCESRGEGWGGGWGASLSKLLLRQGDLRVGPRLDGPPDSGVQRLDHHRPCPLRGRRRAGLRGRRPIPRSQPRRSVGRGAWQRLLAARAASRRRPGAPRGEHRHAGLTTVGEVMRPRAASRGRRRAPRAEDPAPRGGPGRASGCTSTTSRAWGALDARRRTGLARRRKAQRAPGRPGRPAPRRRRSTAAVGPPLRGAGRRRAPMPSARRLAHLASGQGPDRPQAHAITSSAGRPGGQDIRRSRSGETAPWLAHRDGAPLAQAGPHAGVTAGGGRHRCTALAAASGAHPQRTCDDLTAAPEALSGWVRWYNRRRPHNPPGSRPAISLSRRCVVNAASSITGG